MVVSPGISPSHPLYAEALQKGVEIVGEVELALRRIDQPCVGITGTNGKTTVTLLIEHVLKAAGKKAQAVGNVGFPLTAYMRQADQDEILVLELSSYQLETLKTSKIDYGVILNITPDHLDRYAAFQDYAKAKCHLQNCIKSEGTLWVSGQVIQEAGNLLGPGYKIFDAKKWDIETIAPIRYPHWGDHDSENVLVAWVVCEAWGVEKGVFSEALKSFQRPAHRIEFVTSLRGVDYFDDSKGTNVDATIKAVQAMKGKVVLIVGGVDKGASYEIWKLPFAGRVKHILAFGEAAKKIAEELKPAFSVEIVTDLRQAVLRAAQEAKVGEAVLMSPGCSSFDMFSNYEERGKKFKKFVMEMKE